jgi:hypothetical protein
MARKSNTSRNFRTEPLTKNLRDMDWSSNGIFPNRPMLLVIKCCGNRFFKVITTWTSRPEVGKVLVIEFLAHRTLEVEVSSILEVDSDANTTGLNAIYAESVDNDLLFTLLDRINRPGRYQWFENKLAALRAFHEELG